MSEQSLLVLSGLLTFANIAFAVYCYTALRDLRELRTSFHSDNQPLNLEEILRAIASNIKRHEKLQTETTNELKTFKNELGFAIQKVGVHKFNALQDEGGNLSFSAALLNQHSGGLVITSLHNRNQTRIYSKTIQNGTSSQQLTTEEQEAIGKAESNTKQKQTDRNEH